MHLVAFVAQSSELIVFFVDLQLKDTRPMVRLEIANKKLQASRGAEFAGGNEIDTPCCLQGAIQKLQASRGAELAGGNEIDTIDSPRPLMDQWAPRPSGQSLTGV